MAFPPVPTFIPWSLLCVGGALVADGWLDLRLGRQTLTWPKTQGRVLRSEYRRAPFGPGRAIARVRYRYHVDGSTYDCERLTFRKFFTIQEAHLAAYHYPPGTAVTVYHHPSVPDRAVLLPGAGPYPWLHIMGGLAALGGAAFLFLFATAV
jgi:hypothetical protein